MADLSQRAIANGRSIGVDKCDIGSPRFVFGFDFAAICSRLFKVPAVAFCVTLDRNWSLLRFVNGEF